MYRFHSALRWLVAITTCCSAVPCLPTEAEPALPPARYSAEVAIGAEYDSNVTVDELDITSNKSDYALTLDGKIGVKKQLTRATDIAINYDFSQESYQEYSHLNRQTHIVGASLVHRRQLVDTGLSLYYVNSRLDGDGFLELYRASPSLSGFITKKWFSRAAYVWSDKRIVERSDRNATIQAAELDVYYFARGLRSYFNAGYRFKREDATLTRLDYRAHGGKLRHVRRIEAGARMIKLELAYRFEDREYSGITPGIDASRSDLRQRWQVDLELPLSEQSALQFYTSYGDYDSNFIFTDYEQAVIGTRYRYRW
ncbi:surface lipoprotein assembly modifier [Kineobactrum salinum]|uniref:DUF560 domain-containing protein n=1 Tax=Kineobactrum salinum TaxID=2708301 RepID=A0A6C0TYH2_9GAMM|nr:surface lipoprotein assembly modifier [Kineobactrum salinum]QIB64583.1 DUF560 domain-containing protein [Kineobactrum salinum]